MTLLASLVMANLLISMATCAAVMHHHWYSVRAPLSAANRILGTLSDLKGRVDIVERIVLKGGI